MTGFSWLYLPYLLNILILVPVCYQMIWENSASNVFESKVVDSEGLRLLVASLWSAILVASIAGLFFPRFFMPIIFVQIFYKSMWLILFSFPQWKNFGFSAFPAGISFTFLAICITYPIFVFLHLYS